MRLLLFPFFTLKVADNVNVCETTITKYIHTALRSNQNSPTEYRVSPGLGNQTITRFFRPWKIKYYTAHYIQYQISASQVERRNLDSLFHPQSVSYSVEVQKRNRRYSCLIYWCFCVNFGTAFVITKCYQPRCQSSIFLHHIAWNSEKQMLYCTWKQALFRKDQKMLCV